MKLQLLEAVVDNLTRRKLSFLCSEVREIAGGRVVVSVRVQDKAVAQEIAGFFHYLADNNIVSTSSYKRNHCTKVSFIARSHLQIMDIMDELNALTV
ncbi:hypothetical protein [Aeromonas phage phiWae14]|nr:hypothetical protein [Aeromonas phage phiWae14]